MPVFDGVSCLWLKDKILFAVIFVIYNKHIGGVKMGKLKIISDEEDTAEIVKSAISAELKRLEIALKKTEKEIKRFEEEYKVSSDVFLKEFTAEDLKGGDEEYIRWIGELKIRERVLEDLQRLKDIEYVTN